MKKGFAISLLTAILISGCGQIIQTTGKDSPSTVKLSGEDIAVFDKEYSFKTKALTANYIKSKLKAFIGSDNGAANAVKIIKELEYARFKDETVIPFKAMMAADHDFYTTMTGVEAVILRRSQSPAFDQFISEANPVAPSAPENIIYVNASLTTGSNDGTSWANAYRGELALKDALDNAVAGKNIWVAAGTYKPSASKPSPTTTERETSLQLKPEVNIYGGFAGNETSLAQRNFNTNVVILSGDLNNSNSANSGDSYHVVRGANDAVLDGVTIKFGYANGSSPNSSYGGGMFNESSSPELTNVTFSGNTANFGGGMFNSSSSPSLTNVNFSNNRANTHGGGMYNYSSSSPTMTNITFSSNIASDSGGGMVNSSSSPTMTNITFSSNTAYDRGRGMYNISSSSPTVKNTIFWGGTGPYMIYNSGSTLKIGYSIVEGGYSGIYSSVKSLDDVTLDGSTFYSVGNNLALNPLFISSINLALQPGSPAIDAGTTTGAPATDIIGTTRPQGASTDIGAYEFIE